MADDINPCTWINNVQKHLSNILLEYNSTILDERLQLYTKMNIFDSHYVLILILSCRPHQQ